MNGGSAPHLIDQKDHDDGGDDKVEEGLMIIAIIIIQSNRSVCQLYCASDYATKNITITIKKGEKEYKENRERE